MKNKTLVIILTAFGAFLIINYFNNTASSSSAGPAGGYTGSPGDAQNCTACHSASVNNVSGWITSNIPANGYSAGAIYTITATASESGASKFGFQISPQLTSGNPVGQMIGSLIVSNTTETKLSSTASTNDNKYITHRAAGTSGTNNRTWSFNWQAPSTNLKSVTFYGAFKIGMSSKGNNVYLSSYTKAPNLSGLNEDAYANAIDFKTFPNPAIDQISVSFFQEKQSNISIQLFDIEGKLVKSFVAEQKKSGNFSETFLLEDIQKGTYFLVLNTGENRCTKKIIVAK